MTPLLQREDIGAVARLTMNAPDRLNALSDAMLSALQAKFDRLAEDSSIRAIILTGAGKRFCAGHDLKEKTAGRRSDDGGAAYFKDLFERYSCLMLTLPRLPHLIASPAGGLAVRGGLRP